LDLGLVLRLRKITITIARPITMNTGIPTLVRSSIDQSRASYCGVVP
jgi:hypothetical protein